MKRFSIVFFAAAIMAATACQEIEVPAGSNPLRPLSLSTKQEAYVAEGNDFSFYFLEKIEAAAESDYIISPLSMQFLLGMILNGTAGTTADEICTVLGYGAGETGQVNEYCLAMLEQLPKMDKKTTLKIAGAIFVDKGYDLLSDYKKAVQKYYCSTVENLDFSEVKKSTDYINKWCSDHTNGLVPKVLDRVSPDMLAYLLNALYFKSEWSSSFNKAATAKERFTQADGSKETVSMMKQEHSFPYTENDCFQAVRLPYGNGAFSMTVLLPKSNFGVADVVRFFGKNQWADFSRSMYERNVDLWLPRFELKYSVELNKILSEMGMPSAFNPQTADFSRMSLDALCLSFVKQDAVIKVDEEGSEAAAISSAGVLKNTSVGGYDPPVVFHADHPFVFIISESSSGAVLFAGRYSG